MKRNIRTPKTYLSRQETRKDSADHFENDPPRTVRTRSMSTVILADELLIDTDFIGHYDEYRSDFPR